MSFRRVLFLCAGNSCRSQMAEAIINHHLAGKWEAVSAGSLPAGYVHPLALKALAEIGIRHTGRSKSVEEFRGQVFDAVVTLCDDTDEACPVWLGSGRKFHQPYPDPSTTADPDEIKMAAFRQVRDQMAREIPALLAGIPDLIRFPHDQT